MGTETEAKEICNTHFWVIVAPYGMHEIAAIGDSAGSFKVNATASASLFKAHSQSSCQKSVKLSACNCAQLQAHAMHPDT